MSRVPCSVLLATTVLLAVGCAPSPAGRLTSVPTAAEAPRASQLTAQVTAQATAIDATEDTAPDAAPRVVVIPNDEPAPPTEAAEGPPVRATVAYTAVSRTDAAGTALPATWSEPVYLTPRSVPVILPGSAAALPAFTPRVIGTQPLPTDAFAELDRLSRLREAKKARMSWLFGNTFPAIDAETAKSRLAANKSIWLGPDASRWHRDKAFKEIKTAATIDAMLPQLRQDRMNEAARTIRRNNIEDRMTVLRPFNGTYDVLKLILLDFIAGDYTYGGQPVRRGMITAANFYEQDSVRREIATWWEDHPSASASELRLATNRALIAKFQSFRHRLDSYAADPAWHTDAQLVPGLRDPRPIRDGDASAHNADVAYNRAILSQVTTSGPSILSSALYP